MSNFDLFTNGRMLPARVTAVIQNLESLYGGNLKITSADGAEITFSVHNFTDKQLISNMMSQTSTIFGAAEKAGTGGCVLGPPDFQILCAQSGLSSGILLRYLPAVQDRADYLSGFWFY